jgi:hypothetical protein
MSAFAPAVGGIADGPECVVMLLTLLGRIELSKDNIIGYS